MAVCTTRWRQLLVLSAVLHQTCNFTWSTMGATWYLGAPMLRNQSHALSACGTGVRGTLGDATMVPLSRFDDVSVTAVVPECALGHCCPATNVGGRQML